MDTSEYLAFLKDTLIPNLREDGYSTIISEVDGLIDTLGGDAPGGTNVVESIRGQRRGMEEHGLTGIQDILEHGVYLFENRLV